MSAAGHSVVGSNWLDFVSGARGGDEFGRDRESDLVYGNGAVHFVRRSRRTQCR
jgi:hypothetical protein